MKSVPLYRGVVRGLCLAAKWPEPQFEVPVQQGRRWRFDVAWPSNKVALEVNGGVWTQGRHSRGAGQIKDFEKLNAAQLAGWKVLQVTPKQVCDGTLTTWLHRAFDTETR